MELSKGMPVQFGKLHGMIYGGPFRRYEQGTRRLVGVKMAAEIDHPHEISIPTEDFSVPDILAMQEGISLALRKLVAGNDIYAGCMGGIGRTGLFMGCMAKLMGDYAAKDMDLLAPRLDPVKYVRSNYMGHAIETQEQQRFVRSFDTTGLLLELAEMLEPKVEEATPPPAPVFPPLFEYLSWWVSGGFLR